MNIQLVSTAAGISDNDPIKPNKFKLNNNFPNPFNPVTTIQYDLPEDSRVQLTIYDLLGREVRQLVNEYQNAGYRTIIWDGKNNQGKYAGTGVYLYRIQAGEYHRVKKMVLLK